MSTISGLDLPLDDIHRQALAILERFGLAVENAEARALIAGRAGVSVDGIRVRLAPSLVEEEIAANRAALEAEIAARRTRAAGVDDPASSITVGCGDLPQHYRDPLTGETALYTARSLVDATRFLQAAAGDGAWSMVPGVPRDVPPQMQALTEYYVGCEWHAGGGNVDTLHPPEALPYLFEMSEAMGRDIRGCGLFSVSPLRLGGFELDTAVRLRDRFRSYGIASLPAAGASGPVFPSANWAVSLAEVLGGAVVLRLACGAKPVHLGPGMYPFDLRTLAVVGGAPEHVLMQHGAFQVARRYDPGARYIHTVLTQARMPGLQAGIEKSCGAGFAVALGCRDIQGAGLLGFDDVFSPEQFLADVELRGMLRRLVAAVPEPPVDRWLALVEEGLAKSFPESDSTLDHHAEVYRYPRLLDRSTMYGPPGRSAERAIRDEAAALLERPPIVPGAGIERAREIWRRAWRELAGSHAPDLENRARNPAPAGRP